MALSEPAKASYFGGRITRQEATDRTKACVAMLNRWLKSDLEQERELE